MSRFVKPDTSVLTLKNGDQLIIKKRLNRGERAAMFARMRAPGAGLELDRVRMGIAKVVAYLLDWVLTEDQVPIRDLSDDERETILNGMDPEDFQECWDAIDAHELKVQEERDAEKKLRDGATASPAISPSPGTTAGAMSGSTSSTPTSTTSSLTT
jgi:hypothetical protein